MTRLALVVAALLSGCGDVPPTDASRNGRAAVAFDAPPAPDAGARIRPPDPAAEGGPDAGTPSAGLCVHVEPDALERWPRAPELAVEAIARWGLDYVVGREGCPVVVETNPRVKWGMTQARGGKAVMLLNPNAPIVDSVDSVDCDDQGEWSEREIRLVDILTHEFGHVLGLPEASERGQAMSSHPHCEGVFPTDAELEAAGVSL